MCVHVALTLRSLLALQLFYSYIGRTESDCYTAAAAASSAAASASYLARHLQLLQVSPTVGNGKVRSTETAGTLIVTFDVTVCQLLSPPHHTTLQRHGYSQNSRPIEGHDRPESTTTGRRTTDTGTCPRGSLNSLSIRRDVHCLRAH